MVPKAGRRACSWPAAQESRPPASADQLELLAAGSTRYYGKMAVELSVGGHLKWETGYFTAPKGLTSYWKFPLIWPYL